MLSNTILNFLSGKKTLVTGGTGLIGRQVVDILLDAGAYVKIVSLDTITVDDRAEHLYGDLTDFDFCKEVTRDLDCVFHLAGIGASVQATIEHPAGHFVPSLMMNTNVLEASRLNGIKRLVYTSSIGAYSSSEVFIESEYTIESNPMDFAGWAKRMAELQIQAYKQEYCLQGYSIVRPANVFGPGDNFDPVNALVIPSLIKKIDRGDNPVIIWGDGSAIRDFVFSRDVAKGIVLALYHGTGTGFVNLGSGQGYTIRELVETLKKIVNFNYRFDSDKPSGYPKRVMDISLARKMLGYNPETPLLDGLRETWEWFRNNRTEYVQKINYFKNLS